MLRSQEFWQISGRCRMADAIACQCASVTLLLRLIANKAVFYTKYNRDNGGNVLDRMIMVAGEQGVASLNQVGVQFWSGGTAR